MDKKTEDYTEKPVVHEENPQQKALKDYLKTLPPKKEKPHYYQ